MPGCNSGCNYPCYSYGNSPCYGYNPCGPCKQPCGTTTLILNGCICIRNTTTTPLANGSTVILSLTSTSPCVGAIGKYTANGYTPRNGTIDGGGALLNTSQGACSTCSPCCNTISLAGNIVSIDGSVGNTSFTVTGCCGGTLTASIPGWPSGSNSTLSLTTNKACCGPCTTCTVTGGILTIT